MKFGIRVSILVYVLVLQMSGVFAQETSVEGNPVKWEGVNAKDNELVFFIPEGYTTAVDNDFHLGRVNVGARVNKKIILGRYISRVALIAEYYEGDAKDIQKRLLEREKLSLVSEMETGGFNIKRFSDRTKGQFRETQHFLNKNRLYVFKTISMSENNQTAKAFFEAVRIASSGGQIAPNAPKGTLSTVLPAITEDVDRVDDSQTFDLKDADRQPIILQSSRPKFTPEMRRGLTSLRVRVKALFSSSGKITNVEILESPSILLNEEAINTAKRTVFIPAEKGGKLISVYKTLEYSFEIYR